ncbi:hypothetical protein [Corynebacterium uterequi]|uniref:Uncharacterized protein n=1 Tax=Corynebacterium uterequi TaxID=1072256 RepID=A0A0G3HFS9_9CORY|nr:hypothetical protein [Corynebacterium uterequi]AKK12176.1 hypothetical protein CUTER_11075 [Corynebacterium uterequi]
MFHVKLFVKTTLTIPGAGAATHVAELIERDASSCTMHRLLELTPDGTIVGAFTQGRTAGETIVPVDVVPHPDTYDSFPGMAAERVTEDQFDALWEQALALYPELA